MSSVLYDVPGPKAKARNAGFGVVGSVLVLAVLAFIVYRFGVTGQFDAMKWGWLEYKTIQIDLNLGSGGGAEATIWTCDLSAEYVRINGEYRT